MSNALTIKTVIFDLGGVYCTEGVKQFVRKMTDQLAIGETQVRAVVDGELRKQ